MYDPNDTTIDEEQFIRDHLNFLIDSDDEISEGSENTSIRFQSYEESTSVYGISSISSKVSETWSSASSGSITSSKEAPSVASSTRYFNTALSKEHWYSPFFLEDIAFGQEFVANTRSRYIDSILYKVWRDTFAYKSSEHILRDKIFRREGLFPTANPMNDAYQKLARELLPYSNFATKKADAPLNYFNERRYESSNPGSSTGEAPSPYVDWSKLGTAPLPVFSSNSHPRGAEEALNRYFAQQGNSNRRFPEPDLTNLTSEFAFPLGRTSTPINNVAGAVIPEDYAVPCRKNVASTSSEDAKTVSKATNTAKPGKANRSSKQYDFCKFCYKNGELSDIYMSHVTKSNDGTIVCPILRKYVCDLCGATGDKAHTRKYCSYNTQQSRRHPVFRRLTNGVLTSCHNHK